MMADEAPHVTSTLLDYALEYRARGLAVFPVCTPSNAERCEQHGRCAHAGKVPLVRWEAYQGRVPAESEVRSWWRKWPRANIGMATGAYVGIVVLDADGADARKEAMRRGGLDETPAIWTGKPGGCHFWLAHPGREVRNFARKLPGLDFRGDGGYVLLPPSLHAQGARYRWVEGTQRLPLAGVPGWLGALLQRRQASAEDGPTNGAVDPEAFLGVDAGERDTTLWSLACKLRADGVARHYADIIVRQAARLCRPPFDEALAIEKVQRAYREYDPNPTWEVPADNVDPLGEAATTAREPWQVFDAAAFLAREFPPIEWRISGFLRTHAIAWVFGAPGTIKTYIATEAALALATGTPFLGQFATQRGKVLIVQEDTVEQDYQQAYLGPMVQARGIAPADLTGWLYVAPPAGMRLDERERFLELADWLEAERPALVIFDAFYLLHGTDGYGKELRRIVDRVRQLRSRYGTSVWVIDHDRKGGADREKDNPIDRLFGGREKSAGADAVIEVQPVKGVSGVVQLHTLKLRGAKPQEPLTITLADGRLSAEQVTAATPAGAAEAVYEWLLREGGSRTIEQIIRGCHLSERAVRGGLGDLFRRGLVQKAGRVGRADTWIALAQPSVEVPW